MNVQLRSTTEMSRLISKEMPNIYLHHSYPEKELQSFFFFLSPGQFLASSASRRYW